jgi:PleD family two-component response regulator
VISFPEIIFGVEPTPSAHVHLAPIRVLVAEPDAASRRLICLLVEGEPEMTAECVDASRLVSSVQERAPDIVILDATHKRSDEIKPGALSESSLRLQPSSRPTTLRH